MSTRIHELIYDTLAAGQGINLPGIGALVVEHRAAQLRSRRRLLPPREQVRLAMQQQADLPSVIDLLEPLTTDRRHAEAIYGAWLEDVGARAGVVEIPHVGTIRHGELLTSPQLDGVLNPPRSASPVRLRPRCARRWWIWLLAGVLAAALAGAAWHYRACLGSWTKEWKKELRAVFTRTQQPAQGTWKAAIVDSTMIAADSLPVDSLAMADSLAQTSGTRYYVILGMYSTRANAEQAVWRIAARERRLSCTVVQRGTKFLVSAYSSTSLEAANARKRELTARYPDAWIWTNLSDSVK